MLSSKRPKYPPVCEAQSVYRRTGGTPTNGMFWCFVACCARLSFIDLFFGFSDERTVLSFVGPVSSNSLVPIDDRSSWHCGSFVGGVSSSVR